MQVRGDTKQCRYAEIYAALSWMNVRPIYAVLPKTNETVELDVRLWETYRLRH